jgi:hypothetical protein
VKLRSPTGSQSTMSDESHHANIMLIIKDNELLNTHYGS